MQQALKNTAIDRTRWGPILFLLATWFVAAMSGARADETHAKDLFKAMSNYLASQSTISFEYDATLEIVTRQNQKLALGKLGHIGAQPAR